MSSKEQIISLLDKIPDYKMGYVQGITADEEMDNIFCEIKIACWKLSYYL